MKKIERESRNYQQWKRHIGGIGNPVRRTLPKPKEDKFTWIVNRIKEDSFRDWEKEWNRRYEGMYQRERTLFTLFPSDQSNSLMSEEERKRYITLLDKYLEKRFREPYVYHLEKELPYHKAIQCDMIKDIKRKIENDQLIDEDQERILIEIEKNPNDIEIEIENNPKKGKYDIQRENDMDIQPKNGTVEYFVEYTRGLRERFLNILEFQMVEPKGNEPYMNLELVIEHVNRFIQGMIIKLNGMYIKIRSDNTTKTYQIESIVLTIEYDEAVLLLRTTPIKESMKLIFHKDDTISVYNGIINGKVKEMKWI